MAKKTFPEAMERLFHRVYVCKICKSKIKADAMKVKHKKVKCRKCGSRELRPKKKPM